MNQKVIEVVREIYDATKERENTWILGHLIHANPTLYLFLCSLIFPVISITNKIISLC